MKLRDEVYKAISQFTGQNNVLTIPRIFVEYTGSLKSALLLSQVIYWTERTKDKDGWFFKTYEDWANEIMIKEKSLRNAKKQLEKMGLIETKIKKANGNPTVHYRLKIDVFAETFLTFLRERSGQNDRNEAIKKADSINKDYNKDYNKDIYIGFSAQEKNNKKNAEKLVNKPASKNNKKIDYTIKSLDNINIKDLILTEPINNNNDLEIYGSIVMKYLGKKIGKRYRKIHKHVIARLREYSLMDLIDVIDYKYNEWFNNEDMRQYLRPETLFNTEHFDTYLADAEVVVKKVLWDDFLDKVMLPKIEKARKHGWQVKHIKRDEWEVLYYDKQRKQRVYSILASA